MASASNLTATATVTGGEAAYRYARSGQLRLLMLDIGLPQADGVAAVERQPSGSR
jgi:DNA-binding response OmpR family regulator